MNFDEIFVRKLYEKKVYLILLKVTVGSLTRLEDSFFIKVFGEMVVICNFFFQ